MGGVPARLAPTGSTVVIATFTAGVHRVALARIDASSRNPTNVATLDGNIGALTAADGVTWAVTSSQDQHQTLTEIGADGRQLDTQPMRDGLNATQLDATSGTVWVSEPMQSDKILAYDTASHEFTTVDLDLDRSRRRSDDYSSEVRVRAAAANSSGAWVAMQQLNNNFGDHLLFVSPSGRIRSVGDVSAKALVATDSDVWGLTSDGHLLHVDIASGAVRVGDEAVLEGIAAPSGGVGRATLQVQGSRLVVLIHDKDAWKLATIDTGTGKVVARSDVASYRFINEDNPPPGNYFSEGTLTPEAIWLADERNASVQRIPMPTGR